MNPSINYMPPQEFADILAAIPTLKIRKWRDSDIMMLFRIAYWCGLRIGEAIRLKKEDFDMQSRRVYLGVTKTNKGDRATIPEFFIADLQAWLQTKDAGPLFPGLNRFVVYNWLKRLGSMLDIPSLTTPQSETGEKTVTHIFRKSVGKDMMYGTVDGKRQPINVIQKKLRHANPMTTIRYLKAVDEDVVAAGW